MSSFPIPNLPTDNLYKFQALSGLTLLIFSFAFIVLFTIEVKNEAIKLDSIIEDVRSNQQSEKIDLKKEFRLFHVKGFQFSMSVIGGSILGVIGVFLAINGFYQWNKKVQKPLNELLLLELDIKRAEADKL